MSEYKSSVSLQTPLPSASSVTLGFKGTSDPGEARFWTQKYGLGTTYGTTPRKFSHPRQLRFKTSENSTVSQVLFGPPLLSKKNPLAVVSGPRVGIYGTSSTSAFSRARHTPTDPDQDIRADRNVGTGGTPGRCASYRSDGRLLAIGTDRGGVRVCDVTSRAILCTFEGQHPVRTVSWMRNGKQLISGGDDGVLRVWSLAKAAFKTSTPALALSGHGDAIRSAVLWQRSVKEQTESTPWSNLAMTGSYDHTIRVWNLDESDSDEGDRCLAVISHGAPVEALLLMPNTTTQSSPPWLLSAGANLIKVWNPLTGVCVSTLTTQHSKTITSLVAMKRKEGEEQVETWRILTAGLDGLVRIHTWDANEGRLQHIHGVKLAHPITCLAVSDDSERLVLGTTTGHVLVKCRGPSITSHKRKREPRAGTYAYFTRGMNATAQDGDYVAQQERKKKLKSFDVALKQFRYGDALDEALETRNPQSVVAVLEELGKRRGLLMALSNRDEESLEPILAFTVRYIARPQYSSLLIGVAHKLCDIYGGVAGQSETIDELFDKLQFRVREECRVQRSLLKLVGQLDSVITAAEMEQAYEE